MRRNHNLVLAQDWNRVTAEQGLTHRLVLTGPDSGLAGTVKVMGRELVAYGLTLAQAEAAAEAYVTGRIMAPGG